jgi:MiaB-like tRNA modifying enzyme
MAKFYLKTYGCKANQADSELIRGILSQKFKEASEDEADFVVLNSCGVIEKTERRVIKKAEKLKRAGKKVILGGCLPLISPEISKRTADGIFGPSNILSVLEVAEALLKGEKKVVLKKEKLDKAKFCQLKRRGEESCVALVKIAEGCLGNCAFCATKFARGQLKSFEIKNIIEEIKLALREGKKEIQLTSQDNAIFGLDRGEADLPKLLEEILKIKENFRVRIGMMNPKFARRILKELIFLFRDERIYKYLHIPVQSGDNEILKKMRRNHRVEDFLEIVASFKENFQDLLIATDIIIGFPQEDEKSFQKTYRLIEQVEPNIVNITKFSKREGTEAAKFKDIPDNTKTERSRALNQLSEKLRAKQNKDFLGREFEVLITQKGKNNTFLSRTNFFKAVVLDRGEVGQFRRVKIRDYKTNYLLGEVIS